MQGNTEIKPRSSNLVLRIWRGEERLWKVYWLVAMLGGWALATLVGAMVRTGFLYDLLGLALLVVFASFSGVGVWRCAFNVRKVIWGYAARTIIAVSLVYFVVAIVQGAFAG
jgi:hypothetical protein